MDTVDARRQDLGLGPFLSTVLDEILAGLEGVVTRHHGGKDAAGRNGQTVGRLDQADLPFVDLGGCSFGYLEQIRIDAVVTRRDDLDLWSLLAAVGDKGLTVLKGRVSFDGLGKDLPFRMATPSTDSTMPISKSLISVTLPLVSLNR